MIANTFAERDGAIVTVRFIKGNIKKGWVFKFQSEKLAIKWIALYKDIYERSMAKNISKSKETASEEESQPS